mmetsp:Transcript_45226/g.81252  ORF Transcript_45226/g.81252 Transcript_45226/m.81252 type:complete len:118 (+) Transcript_45226:3-356(+)
MSAISILSLAWVPSFRHVSAAWDQALAGANPPEFKTVVNCVISTPAKRAFRRAVADENEKEERREFATQVTRDIAAWFIIAAATSGTQWAPYVINLGAGSILFAVCYQLYNAWRRRS